MTTQEITTEEGNKIIAEFVGKPKEFTDSRKGKIRLYCKYDSPDFAHCEAHELQYHSSWNWLMPIVQKIEETFVDGERPSVIIYKAACAIKCGRYDNTFYDLTKMDAVRAACISFIQFHNQQNKG